MGQSSHNASIFNNPWSYANHVNTPFFCNRSFQNAKIYYRLLGNYPNTYWNDYLRPLLRLFSLTLTLLFSLESVFKFVHLNLFLLFSLHFNFFFFLDLILFEFIIFYYFQICSSFYPFTDRFWIIVLQSIALWYLYGIEFKT